MTAYRIAPLGDCAVRVELAARIDPAINARAIGVAAAMRRARLPGVRDVVPTYRSVAVHFDPLRTDVDALVRALADAAEQSGGGGTGPSRDPISIPVSYGGADGPDLAEVARFAGLTESEVVAIHTGAAYRVFMMGFIPGFAYLGPVDRRIAAPRRQVPRVRVPAGSVGIAGAQTGIYPADSPGGWQIIGRTPVRLFDPDREEPFLLRSGDVVRFRVAGLQDDEIAERPLDPSGNSAILQSGNLPCVSVVKPGLFTTVQDLGRWGMQDRGVPVAGPMDIVSHRLANALAGNGPGAATLETTLIGPELAFEDERVVAVTGAEFTIAVGDRPQPVNSAFVVPPGSRLRIGTRKRGARAYVAIGGGIAVRPVLGSRATHAPSRMGGLEGRALVAGDRLPLGAASSRTPSSRAPNVAGGPKGSPVTLRVFPGPDAEWFTGNVLDVLQGSDYRVSRDSNRMGYRLEGPALPRAKTASEFISDATPFGAIQVPGSGLPLLLMADRQTTGGYPIVAVVVAADLAAAGQLAPGDIVRFAVCAAAEALRALIERERRLMLVEGAA